MRLPLAALFTVLLFGAFSPMAQSAPAKGKPSVSPAIAEQQAVVARLAKSQLRAAYGEAQLELARRYKAAGQLHEALTAAQAASTAYDRQVEVHKDLSELILPYERARVERATAHDLGLQRDRANFLIAELARSLGDDDLAISHYVMVVQSQPDQPLGQDALAALTAMGFAAPPQPSPSASSESH